MNPTIGLNEQQIRNRTLRILYTNYKGEVSWRRVMPLTTRAPSFTSNPFHPTEQWILHCWDLDKNDYRSFAMKDIHRIEPWDVARYGWPGDSTRGTSLQVPLSGPGPV